MDKTFAAYVTLNWVAVLGYVLATIANVSGVLFQKEAWERRSYFLATAGLAGGTSACASSRRRRRPASGVRS